MSIESYYLHYASPRSQDTCSNENVIFNKAGLSTNYPTGLPISFFRYVFLAANCHSKYFSLSFCISLYRALLNKFNKVKKKWQRPSSSSTYVTSELPFCVQRFIIIDIRMKA